MSLLQLSTVEQLAHHQQCCSVVRVSSEKHEHSITWGLALALQQVQGLHAQGSEQSAPRETALRNWLQLT